MPAAPQLSDKLYHIIAFAALVFPSAFLRPAQMRMLGGLAICYGGLIEIIQPLVGRSASGMDFLADVIGVGLGVVLGLGARRLLRAA